MFGISKKNKKADGKEKKTVKDPFEDQFLASESSVLRKRIVKVVIFALIALLFVGGNFALEALFYTPEQKAESALSTFDYEKDNVIPKRGIVRFDDSEEWAGKNEMEVQHVYLPGNEYLFNLKNGKVWGNFLTSNANVNIIVGKVVLMPNKAVFNLEYDGEKLKMAVYEGDVYVGFLSESLELEFYQDRYSTIFDNVVLVPRDKKVDIVMSKLDERIKQILFSKLIKELNYASISEEERANDWVDKNMTDDLFYLAGLKSDFEQEYFSRGKLVKDSVLEDFMIWAEESLTFVPDKKDSVRFKNLFAYLDDAIYMSLTGSDSAASSDLQSFYAREKLLPSEVLNGDEYWKLWHGYQEDLMIFGPGDTLYDFWKELRRHDFEMGRDQYEVVNDLWLAVYGSLDDADVYGKEAFKNFYDYFLKTLGSAKEEGRDFYLRYLTYYDQLIYNLLFHYPLFYEDQYFAVKNVVEQELLDLYEEGQMKGELRQTLIYNKIELLKRLKKLFLDGKVEISNARKIMDRLVEEADDLIVNEQKMGDVAVLELFDKELLDLTDFRAYLDATDYNTGGRYGSTHKERYENYLKERDIIALPEQIWNRNTDDPIENQTTIEEVRSEIEAFILEFGDVEDLELGEIETIDQRKVEVSMRLVGYPIDGVFDRSSETLSDVILFDGEILSERALPLSGVASILKAKFSDDGQNNNPGDDDDDDDVVVVTDDGTYSEESAAQHRARVFLKSLVEDAGFTLELEQVSTIDIDSYVFRVSEVHLPDIEETMVTFDFMMSSETVMNVFISIAGEPVVLDGEYTLDELEALVMGEIEFASQKAEEEAAAAAAEANADENPQEEANNGGGVKR